MKTFFTNFFSQRKNIYTSIGIIAILLIGISLIWSNKQSIKEIISRISGNSDIKTDINPVNIFTQGKFNSYNYTTVNVNGDFGTGLKTGNVAKYELRLQNEKIILTYDSKPDFEIISGSNFTNSGNSIVFDNKPLKLKFKNYMTLGNMYFESGDILEINNTSLLPRFYSYNYQINDFTVNFDKPNFDIDLGSGGNILLNGYSREKNDIKDIKLLLKLRNDLIKGKNDISKENQISLSNFTTGNSVEKFIFSGEKNDINKFTYYDYSKNITKQYRSGNQYIVEYSNLPKDSYFLLAMDNSYEVNQIKFKTYSDIKISSNKNMMQTKYKLNNYHICISQPIDQKKSSENLLKALGTGNYDLVFSQGEQDYNQRDNGSYCMMFYYYVNPQKDNKYETQVYSIYGDKTNVSINIPKYEVPEDSKVTRVIGEKINLLPKNGQRGDKIQIGLRNTVQPTVYIRQCKLDIDNFIQNLYTSGQSSNNDQNYSWEKFVLPQAISCDQQNTQYSFTTPDYKARKESLYNLPILKTTQNNNLNIFQVSENQTGFNKTFIRTNIGLFTKRSNNKYYIWGNYLDSGEPISGGKLEIYTFNDLSTGSQYQKKEYDNFNGNTAIEVDEKMTLGFVVLQKDNDSAIIIISPNRYIDSYHSDNAGLYNESYYYQDFSSNYYSSEDNTEPEREKSLKLYGYSDRALYKPGDTIFVSGWIRNMLIKNGKIDSSFIASGTITVSLNHNGQISSQNIQKADEFGGFDTSFNLGKYADIGDYEVKVSFNSGSQENTEYSFYIRVDEYKKSSFSLDTSYVKDAQKNQYFRISPKYYFGGNLGKFDYWIDYSYVGDSYGYYARNLCSNQNCDQPYYFNKARGSDENSGAYISGTAQDHIDLVLQNAQTALIGRQTFSIKIKDSVSKEIKTKIVDQKVLPKYLIGVKGRDWDYANSNDKTYKVSGKIMQLDDNKFANPDIDVVKNYNNLSSGKLKVILYKKNFSNEQEKGVDGNYYYVNGSSFSKVKEDEISFKNGEFDYDIDISENGEYDVQFIYNDNYKVEKIIDSYDYNNPTYSYFGKLYNNMNLKVNINDLKYVSGDEVKVDIDPYIKGAYAIITLEQGTNILETQTIKLDDQPIKIKVKDERSPNVFVNVAVIVGENLNKKVSPIRQEPRFLIGNGEIKINSDVNNLKYDVKITDQNGNTKNHYQPGEKIKLNISVKDFYNNGIKTRLSVGIVDKALIDLYDILRKPMNYFYNRWGDYVDTYMNYNSIYQALEVFMAYGQKGGDGGMQSTLLNLRKKFLDVAYWTGGAITDNNGNISLDATMPDNLTTWVVDVIGITKDLKLGTTRSQFQTKKDLFIQPNLPSFVSIGDKINIPVAIFKDDSINGSAKITGTAQIGDQKIDLEKSGIYDNSQTFILDANKFSNDILLNNESITLYFSASIGNTVYDEVEVNIPLRTQGYISSNFFFNLGKAINKEIKLDTKTKLANLKISVSKVPVDGLIKAMKYLIHYPYGCTEQLISGLYPILVAQDLSKQGMIGQEIIKDGTVNIDGTYKNIDDAVNFTLSQLYKNQNSKGQMGYWNGGQSPSDGLSIYVFNVMKLIQKKGYNVNKDFMTKLENYINSIKDDDLLMYYYYLKSTYDQSTNRNIISERLNKSDITKVLGYSALLNLNPKYSNPSLEKDIQGILSQSKTYKTDWYWTYFDANILKAFYTRSLINAGRLGDASGYMNELLKSRDSEGKWGWSTQENMQIINTLADYIKATKTQKDINYKLNIGLKEFKGTINQKNTASNIYLNLDNIDKYNISFESNEDLILEINTSYIPDDLSAIKDNLVNTKTFDLVLNQTGLQDPSAIKDNISKMQIGDFTNFKGSFETTKDASQVAVIFQIPSNVQLLNPRLSGAKPEDISPSQDFYYSAPSPDDALYFQETSTQNGDWYSCTPSYYEVRFDRLFLYYDQIKANKGCNIYFRGIKTHDGQTNIMPSKLWEMYQTNVWAQKVVK